MNNDTWHRRYALAIDPALVENGLLLTDSAFDRLTCLDGWTSTRLSSEPRGQLSGAGAGYIGRVVAAAFDLLARHDLGPGDVDVYVESIARIKPIPNSQGKLVSARLAEDVRETSEMLGAFRAVFPQHWLVPPAGHDRRGKDYYDPSVTGRRPRGWMAGGSSSRSDQASCWSITIAGLTARRQQALKDGLNPGPMPDVRAWVRVRELAEQIEASGLVDGKERGLQVGAVRQWALDTLPDMASDDRAHLLTQALLMVKPALYDKRSKMLRAFARSV